MKLLTWPWLMADDRGFPAYTQKYTQAPMSSFNNLLEAHCPIKKYCNWDTQETAHINEVAVIRHVCLQARKAAA